MILSTGQNVKPHNSKEEPIMTNIEKAIALINTFATGDTETAKGLLSEGYIQHNLAYGTGGTPSSAPCPIWLLPPSRPR